jgi:hypothetical protein
MPDAARLARLRVLFDSYDVDKRDTLGANEFERMLTELGRDDADHASAGVLLLA